MITATRCTRLEVWSALQCAGGRRLGIWVSVLAAATSSLLGLNSTLTAQVPLDDPASLALAQWSVVRVWENDTRWDEWVVTTATRDDTSSVLTFTAAWPHVLLGKAEPVREQTADGRVFLEVDRVGQTPVQLIDTLVIASLTTQGISWVARGDVIPSAVKDITLSAASPLQALDLIAAPDYELQFRRIGIGGYAIDLLNRAGADAPLLDLRAARNLLSFRQDSELSEHATVITGQGAVIDEVAGTIADAMWLVTAVSGSLVTLADPAGGVGPIGYDEQLDGLRLQGPTGPSIGIVGSTFSTQQLVCASAPTVSIGDLVQLRAADGAELVALPCPPAVRDYGRIAGTLQRADLPGHRNLITNPVLRAWSGAGTTPPDGWSVIGSVTLSRLTTGPQVRRGVSAVQVITGAASAGLQTPSAVISPTEDRPFLSGYVTLWVTAGQVRVELVATTPTGVKVYPLGGNLATNSELNVPTDLGLVGIDAFTDGITAAYFRVVQHSTTAATVIIESAQLTRSVAQLPFVEGNGGNLLWHAINGALETKAIPRLKTSVTLLDLARLDVVTYGDDCTLTLGGTARVAHPVRGILGTARVVQVDRNLLRLGDGAVVLSDKPEDLSGSLARVTWRPRPIPQPPIIVVAGDVSASTAFDTAGALQILVRGPSGVDSLRAAVSTSGMPSAATVDAATGDLRVDGVDVAVLNAAGPFTPGQIVSIGVRAYRNGVGTRLLFLTDARDAADAAQGPSLEVRTEDFAAFVRVRYVAIGVVTYRINDALTAVPASPFDITKPEYGAASPTHVLYCTRNGEIATEPIPVYAVGEDTVTPDLVVNPISVGVSKDRVQFEVFAYDPRDDSPEAVLNMLLTGCTAVGFTGPGPHLLTQGQIVTILKPLAQNPGTVEFNSPHPGGGTARVYRSIAPQDLTGIGVEVLSNPEFRSEIPRPYTAYDNVVTGLVVLSYEALAGQNTSGQVLVITKAAGGGIDPGSGGFYLALNRNLTSAFVADTYREGALYLITLRARIPVGYAIIYATNPYGTGGTSDWLGSTQGTGEWAEYVLRLQIGSGGVFSSIGFFWLSDGGANTAAVQWRVARINWRDLNASERQPVASLTATRIGGDADTDIVQVLITPATPLSRVRIVASTDTPEAGALYDVDVANGALWSLPRRAFRTGTGMAFFRGRTPGFEVAEASIVIPEQGRDTVPLGFRIERVGATATTITGRLHPTDPYPQGAGTLLVTVLLGGAQSAVPGGSFTMTSGTPTDVVITKPAQNDGAAIVGFTLSNANRVSAYVGVEVEPIRALVPGRVTITDRSQSGAAYTIRFEAFRSDGVEVDYANVGATLTRTPPGGAPVVTGPTVSYVSGAWQFTVTRLAGHSYSVLLALGDDVGTARTEITSPIPTWQEPASGMSDAFSSVTLVADTGTNTFIVSFTLAAGLEGATVEASIKRTWGGVDANVPGVEGTSDYSGVISGGGLAPGPFTLVPFSGTTTSYQASLALSASIGSTIVGSAFAGTGFYVDNSGA